MSGPDLCPKCNGLHFRTAPCIVRGAAGSIKVKHDQFGLVGSVPVMAGTPPKPDRNKSRHRPGYFTEYMREYRARKASKSNPNTPERNDE